jgi:methylmalonyl-CoA/ethylmalonyl-CoA epimerase
LGSLSPDESCAAWKVSHFSIFRIPKLRETWGATTLYTLNQSAYSHSMSTTSSIAEEIFGSSPKPLHLGISVSNLEESVKWYTETLGFEPTKHLDLPEVQFRVAILEYQGFGVELIEVKGSTKNPLAWKEPGPQHQIQGIVHFAFRVKDLDAVEKVFRQKGARFACEPTVLEGLGIRYFHIFDNDGNLIEFGQSL